MNYDSNNNQVAAARVQLAKLELQVAALPEIPEKKILSDKIKLAETHLDQNYTAYCENLTKRMRFTVWKLKWSYRIWPNEHTPPILIWFKGLIIYSVIVLGVFGPATVIVYHWEQLRGHGVFCFGPIIYLFDTVIDSFGIQPHAYYWGLLGGAGAVVSMVKRFKEISTETASPWLIFLQGLFNPIVGSLSAVIACRYYESAFNISTSASAKQSIPLLVIAFFAGFSERLLATVSNTAINLKRPK